MTILLTAVHIIVCLALIGIILLQPGKGEGLGGAAFGGGNVQSVLGTKAADFFTKATTAAAILFMVTCVGLSFFAARKNKSLFRPEATQAPLDLAEFEKALADAKALQEKSAQEASTATSEEAPVVLSDEAASAAELAPDAPAPVTENAEAL